MISAARSRPRSPLLCLPAHLATPASMRSHCGRSSPASWSIPNQSKVLGPPCSLAGSSPSELSNSPNVTRVTVGGTPSLTDRDPFSYALGHGSPRSNRLSASQGRPHFHLHQRTNLINRC